MDHVPLTSPTSLVDDDGDDSLTEIENHWNEAIVSSPAHETPSAALSLDGADIVDPVVEARAKEGLRWADDGDDAIELEDTWAFDNREPTSDVGSLARNEFASVLVNRIEAEQNIRRLYVSHGLSAWGDRMWEFAIALLLINIWPGSLLLVALFGATEAIAVVFAGPIIGDWVDAYERLSVVRTSLFAGNGAVIVSATVIIVLLWRAFSHDVAFWTLVILLLISGSVTKLASVATTLAVEKEWVKLLCDDDAELLAATNARMRRIDLLCLLLAPICVGGLMAWLGPLAGALFIGAWHFALLAPEYIILTWVYNSFNVLREQKEAAAGDQIRKTVRQMVTRTFVVLRDGWGDYRSMEIFRPALALALLYCTVLSFGSLFTAYAYHRGMNEAVLAIARGIGAGFGLLGTFGYPALHRRRGSTWAGGFSIWLQLSLLSLCLIATMVGNASEGDCSDSSDPDCEKRRVSELVLLLLGVVTSRLGLWMFDLAVSQMLQERVPLTILATVNGTQSSMQELLELLGYVLGLALNRPDQFFYLVYISFGFVGCATLFYTAFWRVDMHDDHVLPGMVIIARNGF